MWTGESTMHVLIGGLLGKTVPSSLDGENLATLKVLGASPADPPLAVPGRRAARRHGH